MKEADVEVHFIPLYGDIVDGRVGESDRRLPSLGRLKDEVGEGVPKERVLADERIGKVIGRCVVISEVDQLLGLGSLSEEELQLAENILLGGSKRWRSSDVRKWRHALGTGICWHLWI